MSQLKRLKHHLNQAENYAQWLAIAHEIDQQRGVFDWQQADAADEHPYPLFESHTRQLQQLLSRQEWAALLPFVRESLYRTVGELSNPALYQHALTGTKQLVSNYLDLVVKAIDALCDNQIPGYNDEQKRALLIQAEKNFGRPALMLSGGGTFGIYHLGVIRALLAEGLLPDIISGTSMGSIAAGMLAINRDETLQAILAEPQKSHYKPLKRLALQETLQQRSLLDPIQLARCIEANIGDVTFAEAYQQTGREVCITVSPAQSGQKPRVLNHQTAPEVLISAASKASCSVPGLFPPTGLTAKGRDGKIIPYMPSERWVDGSFATDIPRQRISRLHNVNFFIVSQANPHVLPFVSQRQKPGLPAFIKDLAVTSLVGQGNALLKVAQRRIYQQPWRSWLDHATVLLDQDYLGDINIHPQFPAKWYLKFMKNPTLDELHYLLRLGEQAAWPQMAMIRDQTRISKTLRSCIARLKT